MSEATPAEGELELFWAEARRQGRLEGLPGYFGPTVLGSLTPPVVALSDDRPEADRLADEVVAGTRTATATPRAAYDEAGVSVPVRGDLAIVVDGSARPRALVATTDVRLARAADVGTEHAHAEGHDSVAAWRADQPGLADDTLLVLESFVVLHPATRSGATFGAMFGRG